MNRQARCLSYTYCLIQYGMMENFWLQEQLVLEYSRVKTRKVEDTLLKGFFGWKQCKKAQGPPEQSLTKSSPNYNKTRQGGL